MSGLQGARSSQAQCLTSSCSAVTEMGRLFWEVWFWETVVSLECELEHLVGGVFKMPILCAQMPGYCPRAGRKHGQGLFHPLSSQRGLWPSSMSYGRWPLMQCDIMVAVSSS